LLLWKLKKFVVPKRSLSSISKIRTVCLNDFDDREIDQTLMVTGKKGVLYKAKVRDLADESLIYNASVSATYVGYVRI
jgi:hypothetical protein